MNNHKVNVLVVEDEEHIRKFIKINLERNNFCVHEASTGEEGLHKARKVHVDVVVLDIMLPGIDGFQVCRSLREEFPRIGIVMLTAKSQDVDKITGLECGTDDYMIKPFNPIELVLRVKSIMRRMDLAGDKNQMVVEDFPFKIDNYSRSFYKNGEEIELTPTEYSIMSLFLPNPGRAFKRDELLDLVWGYDFVGDPKIVDVNIRRLRSKIESNPREPLYIETVWGTGYRWKSRKGREGI